MSQLYNGFQYPCFYAHVLKSNTCLYFCVPFFRNFYRYSFKLSHVTNVTDLYSYVLFSFRTLFENNNYLILIGENMAVNRTKKHQAYGPAGFPLGFLAPTPIEGNRAPTAADEGQIGVLWIYPAINSAWVFTSSGNWLDITGGGGVFSSLTVTPGPVSLTGTVNINTAGAGVTSINRGGTGALQLGNATGNTTISGTLTTTGAISATAGNITATSGNIVASLGSISSGTTITAGTGITVTTGGVTVAAGNIIASTGGVEGVSVYASGDNGGVAGLVGITSVTSTSTGAGTVTFKPNEASGNITQGGWLKLYNGTVAIYIPYFTAI